MLWVFCFFQAEDGIRDKLVTGVQTCALPISPTTDGSDPYFPCHAWKLITATGGVPSWSSASVNRRPRQAEMPNVLKKLPETYSPLAVSTGAAEPARRTPS